MAISVKYLKDPPRIEIKQKRDSDGLSTGKILISERHTVEMVIDKLCDKQHKLNRGN